MSKVGRNDPCPCGSGKKYKQCCWNKRLPLGKRKFKASVISSGPMKKIPDLMERTFGEAVKGDAISSLKDALSGTLGEMPEVDAKGALEEYLEESEEVKKNKKEENKS